MVCLHHSRTLFGSLPSLGNDFGADVGGWGVCNDYYDYDYDILEQITPRFQPTKMTFPLIVQVFVLLKECVSGTPNLAGFHLTLAPDVVWFSQKIPGFLVAPHGENA
jgi:hypothetical protein